MAATAKIEPLGSNDTGRCACCGRISRKIWGMWSGNAGARGSHFVHWTIGHVFENGAHFDLIFAGPDKEGEELPDFHASVSNIAFMTADLGLPSSTLPSVPSP